MDGQLQRKALQARIILHFDYDCFYASVFEAETPALRALPLAVQQKQIVVTCNYVARERGLRKLQLIQHAKQICPDLVIVLGEDLTRFRNASKQLYNFIRSFSWSGRVERLGLDEVFLDVTDLVDYNLELLNRDDLPHSFFCLSKTDPTVGFSYDASAVTGNTYPPRHERPDPHLTDRRATTAPETEATALIHDPLALRLTLASHLAQHIRHALEEQKGYTATVGVSTSKLLAKLVGNVKKPRSQTTLLPPYALPTDSDADSDSLPHPPSNLTAFLDAHEIGKIPGIGVTIARKLRAYVLDHGPTGGVVRSAVLLRSSARDAQDGQTEPEEAEQEHQQTEQYDHPPVLVRDVRTHPSLSPSILETLLAGPGAARGIGRRIWHLLHGLDAADVQPTRAFPRQISVEDSYRGLTSLRDVDAALTALSRSLLRRMEDELLDDDEPEVGQQRRWLATPRSLRLSTRPRRPPPSGPERNERTYAPSRRTSRSIPCPAWLFHLHVPIEARAERMVRECLVPLFRRLHPPSGGWELSLLNVAVMGMGEGAVVTGRGLGGWLGGGGLHSRGDEDDHLHQSLSRNGGGGGDGDGEVVAAAAEVVNGGGEDMWIEEENEELELDDEVDADEEEEEEEHSPLTRCPRCGARMPDFARAAHERFHAFGD